MIFLFHVRTGRTSVHMATIVPLGPGNSCHPNVKKSYWRVRSGEHGWGRKWRPCTTSSALAGLPRFGILSRDADQPLQNNNDFSQTGRLDIVFGAECLPLLPLHRIGSEHCGKAERSFDRNRCASPIEGRLNSLGQNRPINGAIPAALGACGRKIVDLQGRAAAHLGANC
jgi:hypothetical protein